MTLINIQLNEQELDCLVQEEVRKLLPHILQQNGTLEPITITLKQLAEMTGLSTGTLRTHVLIDPRIQVTEVDFVRGKRLWDYQNFKKVYLELARNNDFTQF